MKKADVIGFAGLALLMIGATASWGWAGSFIVTGALLMIWAERQP